ncbi:PAX-interacting protein 1, partial [Fragariocoptes setiger]
MGEGNQMFSNVRFLLSARVDEQELIKNEMIERGGKQINYLSDNVTHVIADSITENKAAEEAIDIFEKPVVTSRWIWMSIKANRLLPSGAFSPNKQILKSVVAHVSTMGLSVDDVKRLYATITFYGGSVVASFNQKSCTHVIVSKAEGSIYEQVTGSNDCRKIVTPDWVFDTIKNGAICDEKVYDPGLLVNRPANVQNEIKNLDDNHISQPNQESDQSKHDSRPGFWGSGDAEIAKEQPLPSSPRPTQPADPRFVRPTLEGRQLNSNTSPQAQCMNIQTSNQAGPTQIQAQGPVQQMHVGQPGSHPQAMHVQGQTVQVQQQLMPQQSLQHRQTMMPPQQSPQYRQTIMPPQHRQAIMTSQQAQVPSNMHQQALTTSPHVMHQVGPRFVRQTIDHRQLNPNVGPYAQRMNIQNMNQASPTHIQGQGAPQQIHVGQSGPHIQTMHVQGQIVQVQQKQSPPHRHTMMPPQQGQVQNNIHPQAMPNSPRVMHQVGPRFIRQTIDHRQANSNVGPYAQRMNIQNMNQASPTHIQGQGAPQQMHVGQSGPHIQTMHMQGQIIQVQQQLPPQRSPQQHQTIMISQQAQVPNNVHQQALSGSPRIVHQAGPRFFTHNSSSPDVRSTPVNCNKGKPALKGPPTFTKAPEPQAPPLPQLPSLGNNELHLSVKKVNQTLEELDALVGAVGHESPADIPEGMFLIGCVFLMHEYDRAKGCFSDSWQNLVKSHGGEITNNLAECTHLICETRLSELFWQAINEGKRCVTIYWLNDVLASKHMRPPWRALHVPLPFAQNNRPCKDLVISATNYRGTEKAVIREMVKQVGGIYDQCMSPKTGVLVCRKLGGDKHKKAYQWKLPMVNTQWLSDIVLGCKDTDPYCRSEIMPKYQLFTLKPTEDPFELKVSCKENAKLFLPWHKPIRFNKHKLELKNNGEQQSGVTNNSIIAELKKETDIADASANTIIAERCAGIN